MNIQLFIDFHKSKPIIIYNKTIQKYNKLYHQNKYTSIY